MITCHSNLFKPGLRLCLLVLLTQCTHKQVPSQSNNDSGCTDEEVEVEAQNYRRIEAETSTFVMSDLESAIRDKIKEDGDKSVQGIIDQWNQENNKFKNQVPLFTGMLKQAQKDVEKFITIKPGQRPIISSLPAYAPNAQVIKSRIKGCPKRIIYINEGVAVNVYGIPRTLFSLISPQIIESPKPFSYADQDNYFLNNSKVILSQFQALWNESYVESSLDDQAIAWHYTNATYKFIIAHEYGHDILNHTGELKAFELKDSVTNQKFNVDAVTYNWAQELEADFFATQIVIRQAQAKDPGLPLPHILLWGHEYFLTFVDFYSFSQEISTINMVSDTTQVLNEIKKMSSAYVPKIGYKDLDSLVKVIDSELPSKPTTSDFDRVITKLSLVKHGEMGSHPPSVIRRIIGRVAVQRSNTKSSLVKDTENYGDLYWRNVSKMYTLLQARLNQLELKQN